MLQGRRCARQMNCEEIILEGDAAAVMNLIVDSEEDFSPLGTIIEDIMCLIHCFMSFSASTVRRTGNGAAHHLARIARCFEYVHVWEDMAPDSLVPILCSDCSI